MIKKSKLLKPLSIFVAIISASIAMITLLYNNNREEIWPATGGMASMISFYGVMVIGTIIGIIGLSKANKQEIDQKAEERKNKLRSDIELSQRINNNHHSIKGSRYNIWKNWYSLNIVLPPDTTSGLFCWKIIIRRPADLL